jgi:cyclophilin family peptidyl-prolyl cis-trans isomerase
VQVPGNRDGAGNQFFIVVTDQPALDGQYTVFARVVDGINVAQKISTTPATNSVPAARVEIKRVSIRDKPAAEPEPFVSTSVEELSSYRAVLTTTLGDITIELFPDRAANHVRQFLRLASSGVYDGTSFHRVVKGFVAQTGHLPTRREPLSERQQSYVHMLQPEFNPTPHERGIVSMARLDDPASASSSFFIVLGRSPALDNQYTVFGRVTAGMDVLEKIENAPLNGEAPVTRIELTGVRLVRQ